MHIDTKAINDFTFLRLGTHLEIIALKKEYVEKHFYPCYGIIQIWKKTKI